MPNFPLSLEISASGQPATIGELKKIQQGIKDIKTESQGTAESNKALGGSVAELASKYYLVTQAIQAVLAVAKPAYDALIGSNVELQQQLLSTQASLAATNDVVIGGNKVTDPTAAIQALEGPVNEAVDRIRQGSLKLVGVTSAQLIPIFQNVAQQSSAIGANLDQSADLTLKFAATLGTLGVPLIQQRQEILSILQGTIDQNSIVAKTLGITNEQVSNWKSQGVLVSELSKRLEPFIAGNALAAKTISGVSSNIVELFQNITREAGKPLTDEIAADLNNLFNFLNEHQDDIQRFVNEGADAVLGLIQGFKETGAEVEQNLGPTLEQLGELAGNLGPVFGLVIEGLQKIAVKASELVESNPALKIFLAIANGALVAVQSIESLNGEYAAGTEAADIYRKRSAAVADEALVALAKTKAGRADAAAARKEATAKIDDEIRALKESNLRGTENRAVVRNGIEELTRFKAALAGATGGLGLIAKDTQQYTQQLKLQTEEYKQQTEALSAKQAVQNALLNQARAGGLISDREFAARSLAVEQENSAEKVTLAQKRIADIQALEAKTNDPAQLKQFKSERLKAVSEAASAETSIAQKTVADRKRLLQESQADLDTALKKATDTVAASETGRLTALQEALNAGLITQQEFEERKLDIAQTRIRQEIEIETQKAAALSRLQFDDPQQQQANEAKIRESKQKTAALTLQLLENQKATEDKLTEDYIKDLDRRIEKEASATKLQTAQQTVQLQEALNNRVITQREFEYRKLQLTQNGVAAELDLEIRKTQALSRLNISDPTQREANEVKIRESQQKTSSLRLQLLENQKTAEKLLSELVIKGIDDRADREANRAKRQVQNLTEEKAAQEQLNNSIERSQKLRTAALDLTKSISSSEATSAQIEVDTVTRALEIRKRLNTETLDPTVRRVLENQLRADAGRQTDEVSLLQAKIAGERQVAAIKSRQGDLEQQTAQQNLLIETQKNKLAGERLVIESQIAQVNAQQGVVDAQKKLDELKATPGADPQQIENATAAVNLAQRNAELAGRATQNAQENLAAQEPLAILAKRTLDAQQAAANAQERAAKFAKDQADQLTIVEAKTRAIAAGQQNVRLTRDDLRTIPNPSGTAPVSARQLAQSINLPAPNISLSPSSTPISTRVLEQQQSQMVRLLGDANATLNRLANQKPVVPPPVQVQKVMPYQGNEGLPL